MEDGVRRRRGSNHRQEAWMKIDGPRAMESFGMRDGSVCEYNDLNIVGTPSMKKSRMKFFEVSLGS